MGLTASHTVLRIAFAGKVGKFSDGIAESFVVCNLVGKNLGHKLWDGIDSFGGRSGE